MGALMSKPGLSMVVLTIDNAYNGLIDGRLDCFAGNTFNSAQVTRVRTSRLKIKKKIISLTLIGIEPAIPGMLMYDIAESAIQYQIHCHIFTILSVFQLFFGFTAQGNFQ